MNNFNIGDKVLVKNFFGKVLRITEVTEITKAGNIRIKIYDGLFKPDSTERRKVLFWTDLLFIEKFVGTGKGD